MPGAWVSTNRARTRGCTGRTAPPARAQVALRGEMGTAWDLGYAALFLESDEARFSSDVALPVDRGQSARVG